MIVGVFKETNNAKFNNVLQIVENISAKSFDLLIDERSGFKWEESLDTYISLFLNNSRIGDGLS